MLLNQQETLRVKKIINGADNRRFNIFKHEKHMKTNLLAISCRIYNKLPILQHNVINDILDCYTLLSCLLPLGHELAEVFLRKISFPKKKSYGKLYPGGVPKMRPFDSKKILLLLCIAIHLDS